MLKNSLNSFLLAPKGAGCDASAERARRPVGALGNKTITTSPVSYSASRSARFDLKSVVNKLLPSSRTAKCMSLRAPSSSHVHVCKHCSGSSDSLNNGKAFYSGLRQCGSVWLCPVCAAKISERRRVELKSAMGSALSLEWVPHLVTLTIPHGIGDDVKDLLARLSGALKRLSNGKYSIKNCIKQDLPDEDFHGYIRALEVTHGKNGFHPHYHIIVFTSPGVSSQYLLDVYRSAWQRACRLAGLPIPSDQHGVDVQNALFASSYVSKWGLEDEMTKGHMKKSRSNGITPWGMLRAVFDADDLDYPADRAAALFRLYADAFKGRRQLYWSNGLRVKLGLGQEISDEDLVELQDENKPVILATLDKDQWLAIRMARLEAEVLNVAELEPHRLSAFIVDVTIRYNRHRPNS